MSDKQARPEFERLMRELGKLRKEAWELTQIGVTLRDRHEASVLYEEVARAEEIIECKIGRGT